MSEHPILFSAPMVRALLDGRKTQTRRVLKPQPYTDKRDGLLWWNWSTHRRTASIVPGQVCDLWSEHLRWQPGDLLWVKEGFAVHMNADAAIHPKGDGHPWGNPIYRATFGAALDPRCEGFTRWRPSIHMPRWASRITLEVEAVRVERLHDISEADAVAEGVDPKPVRPDLGLDPHIVGFVDIWTRIHGLDTPQAWNSNPWVSVTTFRRKP